MSSGNQDINCVVRTEIAMQIKTNVDILFCSMYLLEQNLNFQKIKPTMSLIFKIGVCFIFYT